MTPPKQLVKVKFNPKTENEKAVFKNKESLNDFLTLGMSALEIRDMEGYTITFVRHTLDRPHL